MKIKHLFLLSISFSLFMSCGEVKEEITLNKDGSGSYEVSSDIIPMMRGMMQGFAALGMEEGEEPDSAAIAEKVEEMIWKDFADEVDSILEINDQVPPEFRDDPEKMAMIENTVAFMRGGRKKGYLESGIVYNFKTVDDLQKFMKLSEEGAKEDQKAKMFFGNTDTVVKTTSRSFFRSTKQKETASLDVEMAGLLEEFSMYTIINTPKKIKNVKVKSYTIVERKDKSVKLKYDISHIKSAGEPAEIMIAW